MNWPIYEVVKFIQTRTIGEPEEYGLVETIHTWSGPRTYLRQRGWDSLVGVLRSVQKRGFQVRGIAMAPEWTELDGG